MSQTLKSILRKPANSSYKDRFKEKKPNQKQKQSREHHTTFKDTFLQTSLP
jgi:hypothetical protein